MLSDKLRCCLYGPFPSNIVKNLEPLDYERYLQNKTGNSGSCISSQKDSGIKNCYNCNVSQKNVNYSKEIGSLDYSIYLKTLFKKLCFRRC